MRRGSELGLPVLLAVSLLLSPARAAAQAPQLVDRIVARVQDDIITQSDVRELAGYQQLLDDQAQPDEKILDELIEQWVVDNEATAAGFPAPAESEVARESARVTARFATPADYSARLAALGLTPEIVRRIITRQIFLARYLDYKFRPAVQVDDDAIAKYYKETLAPALAAGGQPVPAQAAVADQIREILIQQGIDDRAASWLDDTKSRLSIRIEPASAAPAEGKP